jgi:hypothetical protein
MNESDLFLIGDISGFTPQIGRLVSMMNYVRYTTLSAVEGLGEEVMITSPPNKPLDASGGGRVS